MKLYLYNIRAMLGCTCERITGIYQQEDHLMPLLYGYYVSVIQGLPTRAQRERPYAKLRTSSSFENVKYLE